ncbi:hypothetical protein CKAN_02027800 [Cinnamomum micranthum f. kanehirae]|uniref:Uncharacterized protein n=1 Tax=Cinnamomum micranthum f. kanehirae TaxID=337451 RepID=A0A443PK29_9MAGN|nr:hypothetical protein CKAN_02027800 [Cinnamomum micranthum f. kanehirae]
MSGRKRRDRPLTMDELLRQAEASTPSGGPRPTSDAAQSSSMAPQSRPSTSQASPSTPVDASASAFSSPPSRPASTSAQTGATSTGASSSRGRGPARGIRTWNSGHPIDVEFDDTYHPVGPHARELISQLGHMVRDPYAFPLTTLDWDAFPVETLDRTWQQVKDNLRACPELFRPVCMSKCRKMWKDHKNKVKMLHWKPHQDAPDILDRVPRGVLPDQWTQLVRYWTSEEVQRVAATNAQNRAMQGPAHTDWGLDTSPRSATRMSVWMRSRDPRHPEVAAIIAQYQSRLEELPEEERSLPSRRDEIFHSVVGRDGHGYTLTYGTGIPRSHITRSESSGASSSQGSRLRADDDYEQLLQSMRASIREELRAEMRAELRAEMRAEWRAEMAEMEARLSQSRGPLASDPPPTSQAPDAGSGHQARRHSVGEGSHDPAGSTDRDEKIGLRGPKRATGSVKTGRARARSPTLPAPRANGLRSASVKLDGHVPVKVIPDLQELTERDSDSRIPRKAET